jgi:hypothetical protein
MLNGLATAGAADGLRGGALELSGLTDRRERGRERYQRSTCMFRNEREVKHSAGLVKSNVPCLGVSLHNKPQRPRALKDRTIRPGSHSHPGPIPSQDSPRACHY